MREPVLAVLDIGKTNVKVCAVRAGHHGGDVLVEKRRPNSVVMDGSYPHVDTDGIWHWFKQALAELARDYYVLSIGMTTHGATAACLAGDELALPIADYESDLYTAVSEPYDALRPAFSETGSPALTSGLNLGRQLYWLAQTQQQDFARVTDILLYPQYWGWRLTGIKAGEVTSLGCHTDLWNPAAGDYSSLVDRLGWRSLLPEVQPTGAPLGPVKAELAEELGLPPDCLVLNGIHDSNASLVPHLLSRAEPFSVVSSGTWTVICGVGAPLENLHEQQDMLLNVSAYGAAVPTIRFMGGREWETLRGDGQAHLDELPSLMASGVFALPSFSDQGGPFRHLRGRLIGPVERLSGAGKTTLASVYCALMTDHCLRLLNNGGDVIIEGAFAANDVYMAVLASLCAQRDQAVYGSTDSTGTTQGTAMLGQDVNHWPFSAPARATAPSELSAAILAYAADWQRWVNERAAAA